jgi:hypothetical protein
VLRAAFVLLIGFVVLGAVVDIARADWRQLSIQLAVLAFLGALTLAGRRLKMSHPQPPSN